MSDDTARDVSVIRSAAQLINNELKVQKYLDTELKFLTIDAGDLLDKSDADVVRLIDAFDNDKNTINIIYSLIKSVERGRHQRRLLAKEILQKDNAIEQLNSKVDTLHRQLNNTEAKLKQQSNINTVELKSKIVGLNQQNKFQRAEISRLRNYCKTQNQTHEVELKKSAIQIDGLKNQLIDKRNLSSTLTYGIPLSFGGQKEHHQRNRSSLSTEEEINSNVIFNNIPTTEEDNNDNNDDHNNNNGKLNMDTKQILTAEYGEIVENLTNLIQSMTTENYRFIKFISLLSDYTAELNQSLTGKRTRTPTRIPKPTEVIDLEKFYTIEQEEVDNYYATEEPFDHAVKQLANNVYHHYHILVTILESAKELTHELHLSRENANLKTELEKVTKYWQDALKTLQNWKKYETAKT